MAGGGNCSAPPLSNNLLGRMITLAFQQEKKKSKGHRYNDPVFVRFAMNARLLAGPLFYEILYANFGKGVFPSPTTIKRRIADFVVPVQEGEINSTALLEVLNLHNLPKVVCISEDATAIVMRREYNKRTNSIMGSSGVLQPNGLPDHSDFVVRRVEDIVGHFDRFEPASVAIVVVAKPIGGDFPGIRICAFASNNKFTASDVKNREATIVNELKRVGIEVLAYSADGDARELKAMRQEIQLGIRLPKKTKG